MTPTPAVNFKEIIERAFPTHSYSPGEVDVRSTNLGEIISKLLPYIFTLAGIILFIFLILSGFELLTSGGNPEKAKKAQGRITSALIGFLIIFLAYWLTQLLEVIFGISILQ